MNLFSYCLFVFGNFFFDPAKMNDSFFDDECERIFCQLMEKPTTPPTPSIPSSLFDAWNVNLDNIDLNEKTHNPKKKVKQQLSSKQSDQLKDPSKEMWRLERERAAAKKYRQKTKINHNTFQRHIEIMKRITNNCPNCHPIVQSEIFNDEILSMIES